ncbi:membrane protein [Streptococcus dysgalactiae subsp. dysgalactiae]|uniref:Membrane protein n=1 Tax=Streptococcus dysgalactiae subsp. dysgalactiae TaxID=99822 RepID=A0A380JV34_STRDY|nr:membrane protein [Streptococcus dysgalactiae subsp. dysgalactiae]
MKRLIHSKWLLPSLFIALVLNGIEFEFLGLLSNVPTYQVASALILATSLFGLYLIPFSVGIYYLAKRYQMSGFLVAVASLGGIYISGFLASHGNQWMGQFWSHVIPSTSFLSHWNDALTAPIVEEPIKAFAAILVISLFPTIPLKKSLLSPY